MSLLCMTRPQVANNNIDSYTLCTKRELIHDDTEVDHIIEIQIVDYLYEKACEGVGVAGRIKSIRERTIHFFNSTVNLNVTKKEVNRAKCIPIKKFLNHLKRGEQEKPKEFLSNEEKSGVKELTQNLWERITSSMVATYAKMHNIVIENAKRENDQFFQHMVRVLNEARVLFTQMGIM